jgi:hypothetical protein
MMRTERSRSLPEGDELDRVRFSPRDLLLAAAPPLKTQSSALWGWPNWLIPEYRSGGHRPEVTLLEEER